MRLRHFTLFTVLAFAGLTIPACSTKSLVETATPDETVISVPGMH